MADSGRMARRIVIIGAGFSGTVLAANLLRRATQPLTVTLVDAVEPGQGLAYAQRNHPFLLNVSAGRMSASAQRPAEFLDFARRSHPDATAEDFLPRALYGEYLRSVLRDAQAQAPAWVSLECIKGRVVAIRRPTPGGAQLRLSDGRDLTADEVVLASGNPPPARLRGSEPLLGSPAYLENPWSAPLHFRRGETVLLVGTGLTMADIAGAAAADTDGWITLHAISRHGLLPRTQTPIAHGAFEADPRPLLHAAAFSVRQLLRQVRQLARQAETRGNDWHDVITFVRGHAPALWQRLPDREKRRFLRHLSAWWDVHRHRLPLATSAALEALRASRTLDVHAGRILSMVSEGNGARVNWRPRGESAPRSLRVDRVINCTGPDYDCRRTRDPLLAELFAAGIASPCPLGLGLRTTDHGALLDARGNPVQGFYYIGPMLRPGYWECTAASELRTHAENLAQHLSGSIAARPSTPLPSTHRTRAN